MSKSVKVYFYVEGFSGNPEDFAKKLNIIPDEVKRKGIVNPGSLVVSRFTSFKILSSLDETEDLDKHVNSLIDRIGDVKKFKQSLTHECSIGINTIIYIEPGEMSPECGALFLTKDTLTRISDLECEISFDIYGYKL